MPSLMAHTVAGSTLCPVVWLTLLEGSTTTDAPKKPTIFLQGCSHGGCQLRGARGRRCLRLTVPGLTHREELNRRQQSRVEPNRSQHGCVGSPPAPPKQPELPGDTGGDRLRHLHTTLKFLWHELNPPVPADTHAPTPCTAAAALQGVFPQSETFPEPLHL